MCCALVMMQWFCICLLDLTSNTKILYPGFTRYLLGVKVNKNAEACKSDYCSYIMDSILLKFAKIEPENVSKLSNQELSCLCLITMVIVCMPFVLILKSNISLQLQLLLAHAPPFSADEVAVEGKVSVVVKDNFL